MLNKAAGIKLTYVPFGGTGSAVPALLGNHVTALMSYSPMVVQYRDKFHFLAIASEKRMDVIPDVPTFRELGYDIVEGAYRGSPPSGNAGCDRQDPRRRLRQDHEGPRGEKEDGSERLQDGVHGSRGFPGPGEEEDGEYEAIMKELGRLRSRRHARHTRTAPPSRCRLAARNEAPGGGASPSKGNRCIRGSPK